MDIGYARVTTPGFGVKQMEKAMYEKNSSSFSQELERTSITPVSNTCAFAIIYVLCICCNYVCKICICYR